MLKKHWPILVLLSLTLVLIVKNYTFGTFLSGWDTLHPEFNFSLNFQRVIFGVFRENQGLGAVAIHSHIADLPRILILYFFHFFTPLSFLRYLYIFLMLAIGPLGFYFFALKYLVKNKVGAFLGALFYLLNLGTLQTFFVPFEMFATQYGFLPWLFLFAFNIFSEKEKAKNVIIFSILTLFSAPMAYAATLWYLYFSALILFCVALFILNLNKKKEFIKNSLLILGLTLGINLFWLLPNIYAVLTQGQYIGAANINRLFSEQAFLYNKEFGNFLDISLLKTFYFDWSVYSGGNHFTKLLADWITHSSGFGILLLGFLFAAISLYGFIFPFIKKNKIILAFLPITAFSLFFLINDNFPTGGIYLFLQAHFPLFKEAFRFPDDKVLGLFTFVFSIYFAFGANLVFSFLKKIKIRIFRYAWIVFLSLALIYYCLPAFNGQLISPTMRIKIPDSYFRAFNWFNTQKDDGRIANLPINSFWGWDYYDWYNDKTPSYQGAGFFWFGIKQPLLDRDFDRWNSYNEQYYREMSYSIYSNDPVRLKNVISKYNIHYILVDKSIIAPGDDKTVLFLPQTNNLLDELTKEKVLKKAAVFDNIYIYSVQNQPGNSYLLNQIPFVFPEAPVVYEDFAYKNLGNYATLGSNGLYYPFRSIIDNQSKILSNEASLTDNGLKLNLKAINFLPLNLVQAETMIQADIIVEKQKQELGITILPNLPYQSKNKPVPILAKTNSTSTNPILSVDGNNNFNLQNLADNTPLFLSNTSIDTSQTIPIDLYNPASNQTIIPDFKNLKFSLVSCGENQKNEAFGIDAGPDNNSFSLFTQKVPICMTIPLSNIFANFSSSDIDSLLTVSFSYKGGPSSTTCLANLANGHCLSNSFQNLKTGLISTNYFGFRNEQFKNVGLKIELDGKNSLEKVFFSDFSFLLTKPFYEANLTSDLIKKSISSAGSISSPSILIPFSKDPQFNEDITALPVGNVSCEQDSFPKKGIEKKIILNNNGDYIKYLAHEGTVCDHYSYNLAQNQAYLLLIEAKNEKGLPLSVCLLNHFSKHCDLYINLSTSSEFTKQAFLIPPMLNGESGYDVSIGSLGVKESDSVNDLKSISFIPLPYYWLSELNVSKNSNHQNIYVSSYSYQDGFKAYVANGPLEKLFPPLFGKELKDHVLVNNWTNGWIIDGSTDISNVSIVYLPQYLEYLGLILALATLVFVATRYKKNLT